jgi:hypothetical protein
MQFLPSAERHSPISLARYSLLRRIAWRLPLVAVVTIFITQTVAGEVVKEIDVLAGRKLYVLHFRANLRINFVHASMTAFTYSPQSYVCTPVACVYFPSRDQDVLRARRVAICV